MVAQTHNAVAFASDHDLGELQDGIVGGGEAAILGKGVKLGVLEVALNDTAEVMDLLSGQFYEP
jgi:hypothetical protein